MMKTEAALRLKEFAAEIDPDKECMVIRLAMDGDKFILDPGNDLDLYLELKALSSHGNVHSYVKVQEDHIVREMN